MYKIIFYRNDNGKSEINQYIQKLSTKKQESKDSKIKFAKIISYIDLLEKNGLTLKEPYIKYLGNDIWELRPLRDRILFAQIENNKFILLNYFIKKTKKTPMKEIRKAIKYLQKYKNRGENDE